MRDAADAYTLSLLDKPKRGRPRKPDALSDAQRARAYRARKRAAKHERQAYEASPAFNDTVNKAIMDWQRRENAPGPRVVTRVCSEEEWPFPSVESAGV